MEEVGDTDRDHEFNNRPVSRASAYSTSSRSRTKFGLKSEGSPFTVRSRPRQEESDSEEEKPRTLEERLANLGITLGRKDIENYTGGGRSGRSLNRSESGESELDQSERKSARLSTDLSKRISGISSSMEEYDKKVRDVKESMQEAYRKSIQDRRSSGENSPDSLEAYLRKSRDNLAKDLLVELGDDFKPKAAVVGPGGDSVDLKLNLPGATLSPRKIFGLDNAALLESSSEESSSEEENKGKEETSSEESDDSGAAQMRISIRHMDKGKARKRIEEKLKSGKGPQREPRGKIRRKPKIMEGEPRSLSPIMPSLPDKQFQSILERREERTTRQLNSMKNELAQLNHKVEIDRRKADSVTGSSNQSGRTRGKTDTSYKGMPMKLMKGQPDKNLTNEFNEFVQATGGKAGGWERKDHLAFSRIFEVWRKHPNKLMEALKKELPHKKAQDIASHIKWYERFEILSSRNKQNVHKWSQEKRRESLEVYQMGSASHMAKLEDDKRRQEHLRMIREQERDKSKQKLAQWKRAQTVRSQTATSSSVHIPPKSGQNFNTERDHDPSRIPGDEQVYPGDISRPLTSNLLQRNQSSLGRNRRHSLKEGPSPGHMELEEYRDESGNLDITGVRQHILEITQKVHSLDHPKRDFLPPRPLPPRGKVQGGQRNTGQEERYRNGSATASTTRRGSAVIGAEDELGGGGHSSESTTRRGSVRLPEIDPDVLSQMSSRPGSRSMPMSAIQRSKLSELRDRDSRMVEAKKKAVEIARERRRTNLNQLTAEELRRRIRNRAGTGPSTILNPTKQSELRKSLTHLERLEMLSKQDLHMVTGGNRADSGGVGVRYLDTQASTTSLPKIISNVPSKGVPSWRRPT